MTTAAIDRHLASRGVRYDVDEEQFFDGNRELDVDEVRALLPELSDDEIVEYQQAKWVEEASILLRA